LLSSLPCPPVSARCPYTTLFRSEGWDGDPFRPRFGHDAIIGRGAADMKGGLAAVVAAMDAIHRINPDIRLELLCTGDVRVDPVRSEEHTSELQSRFELVCRLLLE